MSAALLGAAKRRFLKSFFVFLVLLLGSLAPRPAAAQTGNVSGFVLDSLGGRVSGATVAVTTGPTTGRQTLSAVDGSYFLSGLNGGEYQITASKEGFRTQTRRVTVVSAATTRLDFTLTSTQVQGGVVTGTVTRSDTRRPLPDAVVRLSAGAGSTPITVETGSDGVFRFEGLDAGSYRLEVDRDGFTPQARNLTVTRNRVTTANFTLRPRVGEFGVLQGNVEDSAGRNLSNVTVRLTGGITSGTLRTNRSGFFQFGRVIPDDYVLEVAAAGFETQRIPLTVGAGERVVQNVVLQSEGAADLVIEGLTVDELGNIVPGALVQITAGPRVGRSDRSDTLGQYRIDQLPPGTYTLRASAAGFENDVETVTLTVVGSPLRVDFQLRADVFQQVGTISGRVTNGDGNGLANVTVRVTAGPSTGQTATTDEDGDYAIGDLPPGTYALSFTRSGFQSRTITGVDVAARQTTDLDVVLTGTPTGNGSLTGIVRDLETGDAVSGATVRLSQGGTVVATTTTNSVGRYTFSALSAGTYSVRFSKTGFTTDTRTVTVVENVQTTLNVDLVPADAETGTITGLVRDNGGRPIQNALVEFSGQGEDGRSTRTNEDGEFTFTGVPAGSYTLEASAPGLRTESQLVQVTGGKTTSVIFTLSSTGTAGTITGTVYNPSGIPIPAVVTLVRGPVVGDSRNTSSLGRFTFTGLPGGTYTLQVESPGFRTRLVNVIVRAGSSSTISVFLPR